MTKQIETLMALADEYATAIATQGEAHDHVARDALRQALEAALKPLEAHHWIVPEFGFLFSTEDAAQRYLENIGSQSTPTACYTAAPPAQTPHALKTGEPVGEVAAWPDVVNWLSCEHEPPIGTKLYTAAPPAQTHVKQCAQCGKEHKKCSSGGCPKCAPGVVVSEAEFRKPITAQTPPTRLTDEQIGDLWQQYWDDIPYQFARAIEAAHGITKE